MLIAALHYCKRNPTWDDLAKTMGSSKSTLRSWMVDVWPGVVERLPFMCWCARLECQGVGSLPNVTCIVDGVAIPTNWNNEHNYSLKKGNNYNFQVFCTLDGCPVAATGPNNGARHDAFNYLQEPGPVHYAEEWILADSGYQGCCHCIVPFKKEQGDELSTAQKHFNDVHTKYRSRIERVFGKMKNKWAVLRQCNLKDPKLVRAAVCLVLNFEAYESKNRPQTYAVDFPLCHNHLSWHVCDCTMDHHTDIGKEQTKQSQSVRGHMQLQMFLLGDGPSHKHPGHSKRVRE